MSMLQTLLRRILALGLLVLPVALVAVLVVSPAMSRLSDLETRIDQERRLAGRLAALADEPVDKSETAVAAGARGFFIEGASEAIRSAALQSQLLEIAARHGLKPRSSRTLPVREKNNVQLLGVHIQVFATVEKLQALILDIERHKPILMISSMQVSPSATRQLPGNDAGIVDAGLDVLAMEAR